eukprot:6213070-Pleurochrysis_carterae.AAC.1
MSSVALSRMRVNMPAATPKWPKLALHVRSSHSKCSQLSTPFKKSHGEHGTRASRVVNVQTERRFRGGCSDRSHTSRNDGMCPTTGQ